MNRLDSGDAKSVQVIHTNAGHYGEGGRVGHIDFCINGGRRQPYCGNSTSTYLFQALLCTSQTKPNPNPFHPFQTSTCVVTSGPCATWRSPSSRVWNRWRNRVTDDAPRTCWFRRDDKVEAASGTPSDTRSPWDKRHRWGRTQLRDYRKKAHVHTAIRSLSSASGSYCIKDTTPPFCPTSATSPGDLRCCIWTTRKMSFRVSVAPLANPVLAH